MSYKFKLIGIAVIASIIVSIFNFQAYLMGSIPSIFNAFLSIIYIILWVLAGIFIGRKKEINFVKLSTIYWISGTLLLIIGYLCDLYIIYVPASIIFAGPIYGLRYFIQIPSDIKFAILGTVITYMFSIIGWLVGRVRKVGRVGDG